MHRWSGRVYVTATLSASVCVMIISPMGVYDQIPLKSDASFADTPPTPASLKTSVGFCEVHRERADARADQRRSSRINTRGNPADNERVSAALTKPASSISLRVPT